MLVGMLILASCAGKSGTTPASTSTAASPFLPGPTTPITTTPTPDNPTSWAWSHGCPATAPTASPVAVESSYYPVWYAGDGIYFAPATVNATNPELPAEPYIWFSGPTLIYMYTSGSGTGPPQFSGHLIDQPNTHLQTLNPGHGNAFNSVLIFPRAGCWRIIAASGRSQLTITAYIGPYTRRPDVAAMISQHNQLATGAVPATCHAASWQGPRDPPPFSPRGPEDLPYLPRYWIVQDGISAASSTGVLQAGITNTVS